MNTQHTPGPWHVIGTSIFRNDKPACELINTGLSRIAEIVTRAEHDPVDLLNPKSFDEEAQANAQLIAAAPDLLSSCQELVKMVDELLPIAPKGCGWGTLATDEARNAIAKATGQEIPKPAISENLHEPL